MRKLLGDLFYFAWLGSFFVLIAYGCVSHAFEYCPEPKMINLSNEEWNDNDIKVLHYTETQCEQQYPNQPCVIIFKKVAPNEYQIVCGAKRIRERNNPND